MIFQEPFKPVPDWIQKVLFSFSFLIAYVIPLVFARKTIGSYVLQGTHLHTDALARIIFLA